MNESSSSGRPMPGQLATSRSRRRSAEKSTTGASVVSALMLPTLRRSGSSATIREVPTCSRTLGERRGRGQDRRLRTIGSPPTMIEQLRIGVMLPGEASVGAFEAGGLSALLTGVQAINRAGGGTRVVIDAISGASSGALAAVLAARILVTGRDPVDPLHQAWVREPSISALRARATRAPLSLDRARQLASELLAADAAEVGPPQERVWLTLSLA